MSDPHVLECRVDIEPHEGMRLDVYVTERLRLCSRSQARARIVEARVNGVPARLGRRLHRGDSLLLRYVDAPPLDLVAQEIPLVVLFENDKVIVIDKPQGMVVHPGSGNRTGTLLNALLHRCGEIARRFPAGEARPGIVHRLDKDTSGVLIAAKSPEAHAFLARQFHQRAVRKRYLAITTGVPAAREGAVEDRLGRDPRDRKRFTRVPRGGKPALTRYRVLRTWSVGGSGDGYALVQLAPRTGRTHQLRVHLRGLAAPVLGDPLYGRRDPRFSDATLMLHARSLTILLPGETAPRTFTSPLPQRFRVLVKALQNRSPRNGL
jgi:23S rRNA pseudouridine1911/1915/1917 synthase